MKPTIKYFPVRVPADFVPLELCTRAGKTCPGQTGDFQPKWGGGFYSLRGPTKVFHRAVDIMAAIGCDVLAVDDGEVELLWTYKGEHRPGAGYSPKGGNYVRIRHEWGVSYYAHMHKEPLVMPGQGITAGQKIGIVGRTGNALPGCPHAHYSMQIGTKLVDPVPYLKPLYDAGAWKWDYSATLGHGGRG